MKRRKNLIIAFLLVASLALGIGYAAYSTTLTINGATGVSAQAIEFTEDVRFTAAVSDNEAFGTASPGDGQFATFTATGMTQQNDRVQFTYTISNYTLGEVNIEITTRPTSSGNTDGLFAVTTALSATTIPAATDESNPGQITATVTVVLNQTVTEAVDNFDWLIEYTATSAE